MERYERGEQFVEFEQVLSMLRIRAGRIGTPGKEDRRFHSSSEASIQAETELRTRLLREGYRRVTGAGGELLLGAAPSGPETRALLLDVQGDVVLREPAPEPPSRKQDLASEVLGDEFGDAVQEGDLSGLEWEGRTLRAASVVYDGSGLLEPLEVDLLAALFQSNGRKGLRRLLTRRLVDGDVSTLADGLSVVAPSPHWKMGWGSGRGAQVVRGGLSLPPAATR